MFTQEQIKAGRKIFNAIQSARKVGLVLTAVNSSLIMVDEESLKNQREISSSPDTAVNEISNYYLANIF